jgi:IS5 family transposase
MQKSFITQTDLFLTSEDFNHKKLCTLDETENLLDWQEIEKLLNSIYASKTGRPSYPLLSLFRSLLLGIWYKMSDVQLSESLYRDLLFRKFCRYELSMGTPDDTTLGRFRTQLVKHDLWELLLGEINRQLEAQNIIMTEGRINIIDATPIEAAQSGSGKSKGGQKKRDKDAGFHVKNDSRGQQKSIYGYSVHAGVDEDGFIHRQTVTPGNVHDSQMIDVLLLGDESTLYADAAYSSQETRDKLKRFSIKDQVQRKGYRGNPLSEQDKQRNKVIAVTRSGGERPFATYKQHYGLARTRFMGLAKNMTFYGLAAMAANIRKGAKFLEEMGLPQVEPTG